MIVSLIVAMDENRGIGKNGALPWHLGDDLQRFKRLSWGHHLLMGRKTYQSIGRALPGRTSIILTRQRDFQAPGCLVVGSLADGLREAEEKGENEVFVIGGGQIFRQALPAADRLYLTQVHARLDCDVFFPPLNESEWLELERSEYPADAKNDYPSTYSVLERLAESAP